VRWTAQTDKVKGLCHAQSWHAFAGSMCEAYRLRSAWLDRLMGSGISGFVIAWTGFNADKGGDQGADTFLALRLVYMIGASLPLALVVLILLYYPLTEEKVDHVQAELKKRKEGLKAASA
jgi:hypothetical protein